MPTENIEDEQGRHQTRDATQNIQCRQHREDICVFQSGETAHELFTLGDQSKAVQVVSHCLKQEENCQ